MAEAKLNFDEVQVGDEQCRKARAQHGLPA